MFVGLRWRGATKDTVSKAELEWRAEPRMSHACASSNEAKENSMSWASPPGGKPLRGAAISLFESSPNFSSVKYISSIINPTGSPRVSRAPA